MRALGSRLWDHHVVRELEDRPDDLPEGFELRFHWPDIDDEEQEEECESAPGVEQRTETKAAPRNDAASPSTVIERLIHQQFGQRDGLRWSESGRPPWSGSHYDLVFWFLVGSASSGLAWDVMKWLAIGLWRVVTRSNQLDLAVELDSHALRYVALAEAKRKSPKLRTLDALISVLDVDGDEEDATAWLGGPGIFVVVVPDLNSATTHVVVLTTTGAVRDHLVGQWLSRRAEEAKQSDEDWDWSGTDEWVW